MRGGRFAGLFFAIFGVRQRERLRFGERGRGWARLSLAVTDEALDEGVARLGRAFAERG